MKERARIRRPSHPWNRRHSQVMKRKNLAYCFTLRPFTTFLRPRPFSERLAGSVFPWKSKILPTSPGRENAGGKTGEISKCSSIIKVYRFTARCFSYANLAGGHLLGLFLQIFMTVSARNDWLAGCNSGVIARDNFFIEYNICRTIVHLLDIMNYGRIDYCKLLSKKS